MTAQHRRRIEKALADTIYALARAERYSPDLRDHDLIAFYHSHIARFQTALEVGVWPPEQH